MAYERREFTGAAVATTITGDITSSSTVITIANTSGWPSGATGKFLVVISRGAATEEKAFVQSRSGSTLTLATSSDRGVEQTTAQAHSAGAPIEHVMGSTDADEANYAVNQTVGKVTTKGDSLWATGANVLARQGVGANDTIPIADSSQTNGMRWGTLPAGSIASSSITTAKIADSNVTTAKIADLAVTTGKINDLAVTAGKLGDLSVTVGKVAADAITTVKIVDANVTNAKLAGSITTDKLSINRVRAARASNQSITSGTFTKVEYNLADDWDTDAYHDPVTNNSRITIPASLDGLYEFIVNVVFEADGTGNRQVRLILNNSTTYPLMTTASQGSNAWVSTTSYELPLVATNFVEVQVWQNSGGALNLSSSTFSAKRISP